MSSYTPQQLEPRWQAQWQADGLYRQVIDHNKPKHYALTMLPYPSGDLHIGHWYAMTPSDARARYMRMKGYNVMFPMGFDAFGLPAENAAIKRNIHPQTWTFANIERMRGQLRSMGAMFDWEREAVSADPSYYKWTQWFFKKLIELGLAYRKLSAVDFCPNCNTTLAREQVWGDDRHCERCGTPVIKKDLEQWFFKTTDYAEELLDFSQIDWPERVKVMQTNWIGRSEGANVVFKTEQGDEMPIFTTRPDTLWGATFMVMAPEHPLVDTITSAEQAEAVREYREQAQRLTDIDRESADREKTGVFSGGYAVNPVNGARIPIWVADYVLMGYGFGAIMAVPAHDQRDFEFARKFGLEIIPVIQPESGALDADAMPESYVGPGVMVNSGPIDGTAVSDDKGRKNPSIAAAIDWLADHNAGEEAINYRLRDWLISRQRYWGAPIPVVYCPEHGAVPVPDEQLPVLLPEDVEFMPTGESPLRFHEEFLHTECPICGGPAQRETDTMDTFMCSSWYQYRYLSPNDDEAPFDPTEGAYWLPVDQYTGGIEHATMHLIYTRFFTKAMREMGLVDFAEPMLALHNQGMVLGEDNEKMSKSRGNVVAPDDLVQQYGADTVRTYLMFFTKWDQGGPWNYDGIKGPQRLLLDVWDIAQHAYAPQKEDAQATRNLRRKTHQTIRKVGQDFESFSFNTAVAAIMELRNTLNDAKRNQNVSAAAWAEGVESMLLLLAPIAPHITEELWAQRGRPYSIHQQSWPQWDEAIAKEDTITLIVQINGKVRDRIDVPAGTPEADLKAAALASDNVQKHLEGKEPRKVIVVKGKLVNIVR
ncbi:MAG: leucine--tRNA ligase [Ardenticatenaceae bacterium]|nr:leucine--tRNA ligase [Ardenticatenaceae bacterium]MCB8990870.1 leucine--tRNA ligase [Ardenticatenaceae bacterium]MCB9004433.1 leucine--tRNA ligase [Ardenticatenaceae bacterium]